MPRFGKYYTDKWEYDSGLGVGLEFTGFPTDIDTFIDIFQGESCNPLATRRILEELQQKGVRKTTVMPSLNFEYIGDALAKIGVTMKIIEPVKPKWSDAIDCAAFQIVNDIETSLESYTQEEKEEIQRRVKEGYENFKKLGREFGVYGRFLKQQKSVKLK